MSSKYEMFFNEIASSLDLTQNEFDIITNSYQAVGKYLANSLILKEYEPKIFPQGSMRLGTIVKSLSKDDYDIDLVCEMTNCNSLPPIKVKQIVGEALKKGEYKSQLQDEHGRCWTLDYSANPPYHIDILPGIQIEDERIKATIKENGDTYKWLYTNPKGFANWFLSVSNRRRLFEDSRSVEKVEEFTNKNVLQRAVQIIKRHRDVYYKNNPDKGPASIIITTLSALSYNDEATIEDVLRNGPIQWMSFIKIIDGKFSIKVPTLKDDNYADKWNGEDIESIKYFFKWHRKLLLDLDDLFRIRSFDAFVNKANELFTESTVTRVFNERKILKDSLRESFSTKQFLTALLIEDYHPLFSHAESALNKYHFMPKKGTAISLHGRVYNCEDDAKQQSNEITDLKFDEYSLFIPKEKWIRFTANYENPGNLNAHVLFQITNTGEEAKNASSGELRGEFYEPSNSYKYTRFEHTSFCGTHFVQAFLIANISGKEYCVAKSKILTVNVGDEI